MIPTSRKTGERPHSDSLLVTIRTNEPHDTTASFFFTRGICFSLEKNKEYISSFELLYPETCILFVIFLSC